MLKLEEKIEKAIVKIEQNDDYLKKLKLSKFTSIYPFTTENIKGYLENYNFSNQTILTVGASGDHILNLILLGANTIDYFDINPFTEFYVELKIAAIKALEYDEFIEYFCANDWGKTKCFNARLYRKLSPYLKKDIRIFWDSLYLEFTGKEIRFSHLFERDEPPERILSDINPYLEKENYYRLKDKLLQNQYQLHFYQENVKDLSSKLKKKYHAILLSNIAKYLLNMFPSIEYPNLETSDDYLISFKIVIDNLSLHLKENGMIFVAYLYDTKQKEVRKEDYYFIYDTEEREKYFSPIEYQLFDFTGVKQLKYRYQKEEKDAVLVYQKRTNEKFFS